jgi:TusA-related sulfurtransferase
MTLTTPADGLLPLDLTGKFCPQVVLEVAEFVRGQAPGVQIFITSTDPLSTLDLPLFALRAGHSIEKLPPESGRFCYILTLNPGHQAL